MPIEIKDYTWEETETTVLVTIPLKGVKTDKVDIVYTDDYIKVSFPPYIFECLLCESVNEKASSASIQPGLVFLRLEKCVRTPWGRLCSEMQVDKEFMKKKREEVITKIQQRAEKENAERQEEKRKREKYSLSEQMKLEQEERERITAIKEEEKKRATDELERWKEMQRQQALLEKSKAEDKENQSRQQVTGSRVASEIKKESMFTAKAEVAAVRNVGKIDVTFTPRVFPTASRESTKEAEEEWLRKQAEARRAAEIEDQDLTEEEKNPIAMKEKGDRFFKSGNMLAAINAYTHAIRLSQGKMPALYSNRAACHLKLRNLMKAIEDASKALELLTPPVPQNAESRCKAHVRRGTAFCEMELYAEGLQDFEAALKLSPDDEGLQADAQRIRAVIQGSTES